MYGSPPGRLSPHKHGMSRRVYHHDLLRKTIAWMISMMSGTAINRYRRETEECRRNAENAITPIDREAWLRFADHWERLAEGAVLNPTSTNLASEAF